MRGPVECPSWLHKDPLGCACQEAAEHSGHCPRIPRRARIIWWHHGQAAFARAEPAGRFDPPRIHTGVNAGPALVGATKIEGRAGTRWTHTAPGMTTNIAAQAEGGEILLSEETLARLGADVAPEDMGLREIKGVERPLHLYLLRPGPAA